MSDASVDTDVIVTTHLDRLNEWVEEAAADLSLPTDVVFHDVAVSYLMVECPAEYRAEACRRLGIDPGPEFVSLTEEEISHGC